jgi:hypothetical protein
MAMITVIREAGLRVVIFTNDHDPAHVHVFGDGQAKINLLGSPELVWAEGMTRGEVRKAMDVVAEHQALLLAKWREIHG